MVKEVAKLHKKILDNNTQEIRYSVDFKALPNYKQINNTRVASENTVAEFKANKSTELYQFEATLQNQNALLIELNDQIEINGRKRIVSFIETAPRQTGQFNKTIYVGLI
jgi:mannose-6-phosphate isomerase class I